MLAAEQYLMQTSSGRPDCRFDVVSILERDGIAEIRILRGAFDAGPPR